MDSENCLFQIKNSKSKQLTDDQRNEILELLLQRTKNGKKLNHGAINEVADKFNVGRITVSKIWKEAKKQYDEGKISADVSSNKKNCGRKRKDYSDNLKKIKDIPLNLQGTIRSLSCVIDVPKTTLFRRIKEGNLLKIKSPTVKPLLTNQNKQDRLQFCMSKVKSDGYFEDLYDYVHIDVKCFYLTKQKCSYYIMLDEQLLEQASTTKKFITKVMFVAAVARPRYDHDKKQYFDGKIGLWPFVYKEPAKRFAKGTLDTKKSDSINITEYKKIVIENVLPAIRSKFPIANKNKLIFVQHDNTKSNLSDNDPDLLAEVSKGEWAIQFKSQPPNSPDLNVLDLGFFKSMQSLHQNRLKTVDTLIQCVQNAYNELNKDKIDNLFLTLQSCMESIMIEKGGNKYKFQYMNKQKLYRDKRLPVSILCSQDAVETALINVRSINQ